MGDPRSEMTRAYKCDACGAENVKLWRGFHGCKDSKGRELKCARCLTDKPVDDGGRWDCDITEMRTDQVGGWLPAVPTGDTYWGYTSVPQCDVEWWKALPTYPMPPDPRDARIAELEAALAGLVDALPRCTHGDGCSAPATLGYSSHDPSYCEPHRRDAGYPEALRTCDTTDAIEAAERALGRRK